MNFINLGGKRHNKLVLTGHQGMIVVPRRKVIQHTLSSIVGETARIVGMSRQQVMQILFTSKLFVFTFTFIFFLLNIYKICFCWRKVVSFLFYLSVFISS
jgi:hypothetical protein